MTKEEELKSAIEALIWLSARRTVIEDQVIAELPLERQHPIVRNAARLIDYKFKTEGYKPEGNDD